MPVCGKSTACEQPGGAPAAPQGQHKVMGDVSNKSNAKGAPRERQAAAGGSNAPPVLDWWRSQRLTSSDGVVVQAVGVSQNQVSPGRPPVLKDAEADYCSPTLKMAGYNPDGHEEPWTKAQLHSLRRAQADTALSASDFWGAVASNVQDRDPQQCQQKWFEHFATPRGRRRKSSKQSSPSLSVETALLSDNTSRSSREVVTAAHDSPERINHSHERSGGDDLFQATPMRGRTRFGPSYAGGELEAKTPRTPAGPDVPTDDASATEPTPGGGHADYNQRGVSRTYVKAMSKKMRKGASRLGNTSMPTQERRAKKPPFGSAGRTIHAAAVSQGHKLKVSVTPVGDVNLASTCSDEDSVGLSGSCESDDE